MKDIKEIEKWLCEQPEYRGGACTNPHSPFYMTSPSDYAKFIHRFALQFNPTEEGANIEDAEESVVFTGKLKGKSYHCEIFNGSIVLNIYQDKEHILAKEFYPENASLNAPYIDREKAIEVLDKYNDAVIEAGDIFDVPHAIDALLKSGIYREEKEWITEKPKYDDLKPCLIITRHKYKSDPYEYSVYEIKRIDFEGNWYWGICDIDGEEIGDYNEDFSPKELKIIYL